MLTTYETHLLRLYLANAASGLHHRNPEVLELIRWIAEQEHLIKLGSKWQPWLASEKNDISAKELRSLGKDLRNKCSLRR